mgnify:FL=1
MSLKFEIDTVEGLDASIAGLYDKTESGKFRLKVEGIEDVGGLKKKVDELLSEKKAAAQARAEAERAAAQAAEEAARKSGDVAALEKSWQEKYSKGIGEKDSELSALRGSLNKMLVDNVAVSLANELAVQGSAAILIPHIKARLEVDTTGGEPKTIVLGTDGKRSALTVEELKAEFAANQAFAPVLAGSKATGGGASGTGAGGGAAKTVSRAQFEQMSAGQQMEHIRAGGKVN